MAAERVSVPARAKVNLYLHVTGRRPDGYHLLDSLVVFPELGDEIVAEAADGFSLTLGGLYAGALDAGEGNLVRRAADAMRAAFPGRGAKLHLEKRLPIASGIGGGSADAAATIAALERLWQVSLAPEARRAMELTLGADVPVCGRGQPCRMRGIGEEIEPLDGLPGFWLVLVNPGLPVPTGAVFRELDGFGPAACWPGAGTGRAEFGDPASLAAWLLAQRNDLERPAFRIAPEIRIVLSALSGLSAVLLARMSGSGGTCFAICADEAGAESVRRTLRDNHPSWWIAAAPVRGGSPPARV